MVGFLLGRAVEPTCSSRSSSGVSSLRSFFFFATAAGRVGGCGVTRQTQGRVWILEAGEMRQENEV
jgi:hypothetical protein